MHPETRQGCGRQETLRRAPDFTAPPIMVEPQVTHSRRTLLVTSRPIAMPKGVAMRFVLYSVAIMLFSAPVPNQALAQSTDCGVVGISSEEAPPPLPDYDQPPIPAPGYQWTPGYWAWNNVDYYWVPGTWIAPPQPDVLWTPPYWAFVAGAYVFHRGYWGPHVGFYGGVPYGYGYTGNGFEGGHWDHGAYYYNRTVTNFGNVHITNVYDKTVVINNNSRVSYNGGRGGIIARPTPADEALARAAHIPPTHAQTQHLRTASMNSDSLASANHGKPAVAATRRPGDFKGPGAMPSREGGQPGHGMHAPMQTPAANEKPGVTSPMEPRHNPPLSKRPDGRGGPQTTPREPNVTGKPNEAGGDLSHQPMTKRGGAGAGVGGMRKTNEMKPVTPPTDHAKPGAPEHATPHEPQMHGGGGGMRAGAMPGGGAMHMAPGGAGRPERSHDNKR
jgi:hypothetical protein